MAAGIWYICLYRNEERSKCPPILNWKSNCCITDFRRLDATGKRELLDYAAFLLKKSGADATSELPKLEDQCRLDPRSKERPETVKEPIFTE